jgi:GxxExxY protein
MLTDPHGTNELTRRIVGCAIRVHSAIGPGALESVYHECMTHEFREEKLAFESGRAVTLVYRGTTLKARFYIDLVVENTVAVELKAIETLAQVHTRQVLTQLRLSGLPVGLLINFDVTRMVDGVRRVVNPNPRNAGSVAP